MQAAARERDALKVKVAGIGEKVARAREEAVQEYKDNFKDTDDYLDLMKDAMVEYKIAMKKANLNFDSDYYDNLIFGEPLTTAPEDPSRFEQLDPIGTIEATAEQDTTPAAEPVIDAPTQQ